ncbi:hypothetical protein FOMG_08862 [Fusarium oxysporum f. sp. melonis 26406]|jgi:hypothetical protein|uniref:Uncharacterized protein n=1 Tax=Fusarium oxysporum f. sp. melonis 26406 TaxID=1089452 RepID=X0A521_FUSOX|nr:hypothetical protein FOMG_08862 [Fusarium oxysporum f. sp. melonis 26406]
MSQQSWNVLGAGLGLVDGDVLVILEIFADEQDFGDLLFGGRR